MKFIKIILAMLVMALSFSSCLESDLKDLPTSMAMTSLQLCLVSLHWRRQD